MIQVRYGTIGDDGKEKGPFSFIYGKNGKKKGHFFFLLTARKGSFYFRQQEKGPVSYLTHK